MDNSDEQSPDSLNPKFSKEDLEKLEKLRDDISQNLYVELPESIMKSLESAADTWTQIIAQSLQETSLPDSLLEDLTSSLSSTFDSQLSESFIHPGSSFDITKIELPENPQFEIIEKLTILNNHNEITNGLLKQQVADSKEDAKKSRKLAWSAIILTVLGLISSTVIQLFDIKI